jgi:hypothetical protein
MVKKSRSTAKGEGDDIDRLGLPAPSGSLAALLKADFLTHGSDVIGVVRRKHPTIYLRLVADELPRELGMTALALGDIGDEELAKIIGDLRARIAAADGTRAKPPQRRK